MVRFLGSIELWVEMLWDSWFLCLYARLGRMIVMDSTWLEYGVVLPGFLRYYWLGQLGQWERVVIVRAINKGTDHDQVERKLKCPCIITIWSNYWKFGSN